MARNPRLAALGALAAFAAGGALLGLAGCLPDGWDHHGGNYKKTIETPPKF